ncbi:hypothetical protein KACC15558_11140 [Brevibacterium ammoniilyticum]|uniref:DUF3846 domain-containing protein n=2 Tax=Brevibacterium ammoniilyticum TaxID=1046555 RepID=A0ABP9U1M4_9MICO
MARGLYVPAYDGEPLEMRDFEGDAIGTAVGGLMEAVDIPALGITVYVNEEGLLRRLPFNSRVSFAWWYYVPEARRSMLVGDAVIVGEPDIDGADTDIPESTLEMFINPRQWGILIDPGGMPASGVMPDTMLNHVLLPLVAGRPQKVVSTACYASCFDAMAWALSLGERWPEMDDFAILPMSQVLEHFGVTPSE